MKYKIVKTEKCPGKCYWNSPVGDVLEITSDINEAFSLLEKWYNHYKEHKCTDCKAELVEYER